MLSPISADDRRALARLIRHPRPPKRAVWELSCERADERTLSVQIRTPDEECEVFFRSAELELRPSAEGAITAVYVAAAHSGADIRVSTPVDATFLANLRLAAVVLYSWADDFSSPEIIAPVSGGRRAKGPGRLMPFTGGVDFTFSLLAEATPPELLLHVSFSDARFLGKRSAENLQQVETRLRDLARKAGTKLAIVETNIRQFCDPRVSYARFSHGSMFAAIGHFTHQDFGQILIPSSHPAGRPNGSHFILDPLWSSSGLQVIHHGTGTTRIEKVAFLASRPETHSTLKMCNTVRDPNVNCGKCAKCVTTMLMFHLCGVDRVNGASFENLTVPRLLLNPLRSVSHRRMAIETIRLAEHLNVSEKLRRTLRLNYALQTRLPRLMEKAWSLLYQRRPALKPRIRHGTARS